MQDSNSLYKIFAGYFSILDENGNPTNYYKNYDMFRNTYGLVFFFHSSTKGRYHAVYFARDCNGWNYRTTFRSGKIIDGDKSIGLKVRYNTYIWDASEGPTIEELESLHRWVKENSDTCIPGFSNHSGIKEYFEDSTMMVAGNDEVGLLSSVEMHI